MIILTILKKPRRVAEARGAGRLWSSSVMSDFGDNLTAHLDLVNARVDTAAGSNILIEGMNGSLGNIDGAAFCQAHFFDDMDGLPGAAGVI